MKKRIFAIVLAMVLVFSLVACGGKKDETKPADTQAQESQTDAPSGGDEKEVVKLKFGYAPPDTTEVFESCRKYLEKAVESANASGLFDIELITVQPEGGETNYESQVSNLENLLSQGCDAIFCSPGSADACHNVFEEINKANVPLILFNILEAPEGIDGYIVGFDNYTASQVAGYAFLDYYGGPGVLGTGDVVDIDPSQKLNLAFWEDLYKDFDYSKIENVNVAIVSGIQGSIYTVERTNGFIDTVSQSPNVKVLTELNADWDRAKATQKTENILEAYPDVNCIYAESAEMELGAYNAIASAGKEESIIVMGNDGTNESLQAIADGKITAETWHGFPEWGWFGVETAVKLCLGIECDKFIDINPRTEYAANIELFIDPEFDAIDWQAIYDGKK